MLMNKITSLFKKTMIMNRDFDIDTSCDYQNKSDQMVPFRILTGKFRGIVFSFGKLTVSDKVNDDGTISIEFDFKIIDSKNYNVEKLEKNKSFVNTLGAILNSIVISGVEREVEKHDEETGNDYFEEFDTKRRVRTKSSTIPN